ncbi:hypothetical protein [Candidatus Methanocrinis natronophilus]|uniref:DNRLRE domain-containing protein n=1 Tax=Candidatus Methanocrinis natronophilus TaxID=3033396 RepID=A0ABT5X4K9_9EURY|nr:hypothetical protein [Candidatus Methanocrinis natronophilus]MDF0589626.1 hypothetical protein [Candidatus Methanocrinis natronophilus]
MQRGLLRMMVVLAVFAVASSFAAASTASDDGGGLLKTEMLEDMGGEKNDTLNDSLFLPDIVPSMDGANVTVKGEDDAIETEPSGIGGTDPAMVPEGGVEAGSDHASAEAETLASPFGRPATGSTSSFVVTMTAVPAVADLYVDLTAGRVYNEDRLVAMYLVGADGVEEDFPGVVMVQFDLSGLEVGASDVAVLVLKAESVEKIGDEMAGIVTAPVTSGWSEGSSPTALTLNMLATFFMITGGDYTDFGQVGMNFGGDEVFAFDVSEHVMGADGGKISFLVLAVGDTDYKVTFRSRETGEGPTLLVGPYPAVPAAVV